MRYGYWCLWVVLAALAPGANAQRQGISSSELSRVCLFVDVRIDGERATGHEGTVLELLEGLAKESGIQVLGAQACASLSMDAAPEDLRLLLHLQMNTLPNQHHAYRYDLTEVLDDPGEFTLPRVQRFPGFGFAVQSEQDAVLAEVVAQAVRTHVASWASKSGADTIVGETSEQREGPTPNGGAYSIAYYRDENGNPATKDRARSVEIIEYNVDGEPMYSTIGYLNR